MRRGYSQRHRQLLEPSADRSAMKNIYVALLWYSAHFVENRISSFKSWKLCILRFHPNAVKTFNWKSEVVLYKPEIGQETQFKIPQDTYCLILSFLGPNLGPDGPLLRRDDTGFRTHH